MPIHAYYMEKKLRFGLCMYCWKVEKSKQRWSRSCNFGFCFCRLVLVGHMHFRFSYSKHTHVQSPSNLATSVCEKGFN